MELRSAVEDDGEFLFALHRAALGDVIEATWGRWDDAVQRRFHATWFADFARLLIVMVDGQPVGVLDVCEQPGEVLYLARIELLPAVQGRGLGSRLVGQVIDQARRSGLAAVELDVLDRNQRARRLYERLGFETVWEKPPKQRMRLAVQTQNAQAGRGRL